MTMTVEEIRKERDRIEKRVRDVCGQILYLLEYPGEKNEEFHWGLCITEMKFLEGALVGLKEKCRNRHHKRKNPKGNCPDCGLVGFTGAVS